MMRIITKCRLVSTGYILHIAWTTPQNMFRLRKGIILLKTGQLKVQDSNDYNMCTCRVCCQLFEPCREVVRFNTRQ